MDATVLFNLSYGLYVIGAKNGERYAGCVVNTVTQATSKPLTLTVCINKDNFTNLCIKNTNEFTVSILSENARPEIFGIFGFRSSRDNDKFAETQYGVTPSGLPYLTEGAVGYIQCKVIGSIDDFTHTIFVAEILDAQNLNKEPPMTYAYYHKVVKGKTPKNASSYIDPAALAKPEGKPGAAGGVYVCGVCGYEYPGGPDEFIQHAADYTCPICKAPKSKFALR